MSNIDVKKDILWRVYLCFIMMIIIGVIILGRAFFIQQVQGKYWRSMSDSLHQRIEEVEAERGTIYSSDGQMLSTSIPRFDIYIDFGADGLHEIDKKSKKNRFFENLDSLSYCLSMLFADKSKSAYKQLLLDGYNSKSRYFLLKKDISYRNYQALQNFPLVRLGKNKSGFVSDTRSKRLNPYNQLAYRTIGLDRENAHKIGLEEAYDSVLKGRSGDRLVRFIAGGVAVPVDDYQIEPVNGKDIMTNLDVFIQEVTEGALKKMMIHNKAEHGCAIVMETKTGKIKAMANLGRGKDGNYWEDYNYAISPAEPGSTFKLVSLISMLEDHKTDLDKMVNLGGGEWKIYGRTVFDSEKHGEQDVTAKRAFELSSNVGLAKLVWNAYASDPNDFIRHIHDLRMDTLTGIDLSGEKNSLILKPGSKYWNATTLPWMAFGYNVLVTPLQTLTLYNAIANGGRMMKPYLVNAIQDEGVPERNFAPTTIAEKICSAETLAKIKQCLEGVCTEGTAQELFRGLQFKVAGKTGTAQIANGKRGYADHIYLSSFVGYFPADDPQYTCIVVIKNTPQSPLIYGASVAGPVFKEIAERLYASCCKRPGQLADIPFHSDTTHFSFSGSNTDMNEILKGLNIADWKRSNGNGYWGIWYGRGNVSSEYSVKSYPDFVMPSLKNMGLKDVLFSCESMGVRVMFSGRGKVISQSVAPGSLIHRGTSVSLQLR